MLILTSTNFLRLLGSYGGLKGVSIHLRGIPGVFRRFYKGNFRKFYTFSAKLQEDCMVVSEAFHGGDKTDSWRFRTVSRGLKRVSQAFKWSSEEFQRGLGGVSWHVRTFLGVSEEFHWRFGRWHRRLLCELQRHSKGVSKAFRGVSPEGCFRGFRVLCVDFKGVSLLSR